MLLKLPNPDTRGTVDDSHDNIHPLKPMGPIPPTVFLTLDVVHRRDEQAKSAPGSYAPAAEMQQPYQPQQQFPHQHMYNSTIVLY